MKTQLSKLEIIDDTVAYYSIPGRRSLNPEAKENHSAVSCLYNGPNGVHCAFARVVENPQELEEGQCASHVLKDAILKQEYQGHDGYFWDDVQALHDGEGYWSDEGPLTQRGQQKANQLKTKYANL
jgi:hypothetical protein